MSRLLIMSLSKTEHATKQNCEKYSRHWNQHGLAKYPNKWINLPLKLIGIYLFIYMPPGCKFLSQLQMFANFLCFVWLGCFFGSSAPLTTSCMIASVFLWQRQEHISYKRVVQSEPWTATMLIVHITVNVLQWPSTNGWIHRIKLFLKNDCTIVFVYLLTSYCKSYNSPFILHEIFFFLTVVLSKSLLDHCLFARQ